MLSARVVVFWLWLRNASLSNPPAMALKALAIAVGVAVALCPFVIFVLSGFLDPIRALLLGLIAWYGLDAAFARTFLYELLLLQEPIPNTLFINLRLVTTLFCIVAVAFDIFIIQGGGEPFIGTGTSDAQLFIVASGAGLATLGWIVGNLAQKDRSIKSNTFAALNSFYHRDSFLRAKYLIALSLRKLPPPRDSAYSRLEIDRPLESIIKNGSCARSKRPVSSVLSDTEKGLPLVYLVNQVINDLDWVSLGVRCGEIDGRIVASTVRANFERYYLKFEQFILESSEAIIIIGPFSKPIIATPENLSTFSSRKGAFIVANNPTWANFIWFMQLIYTVEDNFPKKRVRPPLSFRFANAVLADEVKRSGNQN